MSTGRRIAWVDVAKGLAMLAVIVGHTMSAPSVVRVLPISFHIPLFFFLSGYTAHVRSMRDLLRRGVRSLLPLWLALALLKTAAGPGAGALAGGSAGETMRVFGKSLAYNLGFSEAEGIPAVGSGWYLFAFFWARLLLNAWEALVARRGVEDVDCAGCGSWRGAEDVSQVRGSGLQVRGGVASLRGDATGRLGWPAVTLALAVAASVGGAMLARILGEVVPLSGASILVGWGFMLGGTFACQCGGFEWFLREERGRKLGLVVVLALAWAACAWFADINIGSNIYRGPLVLVFGRAWCGLLLVCGAAALIERNLPKLCRFLSWVGQHSLAVYVVHSIELSVLWGLLPAGALASLESLNWVLLLALRLVVDLACSRLLLAASALR